MRRAHVHGARVGRGGATLLMGATAVVMVAAAILALTVRRVERSPTRRLAEAVGVHRVTRARLTGGFAYASCDTATPNDSLIAGLICEGPRPGQWREARALSRLAEEWRTGSASGGGATNGLHAAGTWHVIWANAADAVDRLRAAAQADPTDARIQNDLAAALLQRAQVEQDPLHFLDAYSANERALALDPRLPEAVFNRALILERLHLTDSAAGQWQSYLALDPRSAWAEEARAHLRALRAPRPEWSIAQRHLARAVASNDSVMVRRIAWQFAWRVRSETRAALIAWGTAYGVDPARADSVLAHAAVLARALRDTTTDAMWFDIADALDRNRSGADTARARETAAGFVAYGRGRAAFDRLSLDSAAHWFEHAQRSFHRARNPAAHLAAYDLARVSYQRHTSAGDDDALARLRRIVAAAPRQYVWVRGLAIRTVGFIEFVGGKFDVASSAFAAAIDLGGVAREPALALRTRTDAARLVAMLRGEPAGWKSLYAVFRAALEYPDTPIDAQRVYSTAAVLSWRRAPGVAPLFQREFVRLTESLNDSLLMVSALTREAELLAREGRPAEAVDRLRRVSAYAAGIQSDSIRGLMLADAELVHGEVWLHDRPDSAVRLLRGVVARYADTRYFAQVGRAKLLLASAFVATGAMDSAQRAFDEALAATERARSSIASFEDRGRFLDEARPVIDGVVGFHVSRHDTIGALEFMERMRARVLLERAARSAGPNVERPYRTVGAIRTTLDSHTSVLTFAVLDGESIGWLIRRDGVWMARLQTGDSLRALVERFAHHLSSQSADGDIAAASARIYEQLVRPFESRIPTGSRLVVVPDKWLHAVPFAALFDSRREQFLVQAHELGVAPSVQLFAEAAERYGDVGDVRATSVLAVGNPAFDPDAYGLPLLPGAEREARSVASRYSRSRLLIGPEATREAFLAEAPGASVIHFAGHGVVSPDSPLLSQLVLAPGAGGTSSGAVYARDLFELRLPATRLAILSGCQTAAGTVSSTEGVSSLARALFAAGVPAVIASLWAVDDRETAAFFESYHDFFARDGNPAAALRRTQVQWIERGDPWGSARTWAAFQLFGAAGTSGAAVALDGNRALRPSNPSRKALPPQRRLGP